MPAWALIEEGDWALLRGDYGRRPSADAFAARIASFWLPDEPIVYIGLATSLRSRVSGFYRTPIGARRPHAGGWLLKTLSILDRL